MFDEIKNRFEQNRNAEYARQMSQYMRNQFEYYGLATPVRKTLYKDFLKSEKAKSAIDWAFLDKCWASESREFQYVAIDYLTLMQKLLTYDDIPKLKRFVQTKPWWDSIDGLDRIIGDIGLTDNRVDALMLAWSVDSDFWVRRVAIDHQLSRKDRTNADLLARIICNNFGSAEFFINKAIGWSLREYAKCNPQWVREFVEKHKPQMATLSIREATKHL